ncbi:MAG: hypothetical protein HC769_25485 [Cyanobacteria bacterium CRU_2_1]|nr:hypothetical protein [Cyanobacteria bacterium CRU_2_1]
MKYPKWFPYPSSWLNAILLAFLTGLVGYVMQGLIWTGFGMSVMVDAPEPVIIMSVVAILSPIVVIAAVHHIIHLFLTQFAPKLQAPEIGKTTGLFPGLFSWWEGLWSWMTMMVSILMCLIIMILAHEGFNVSFDKNSVNSEVDIERLSGFLGCIWLTITAYLYQFTYLAEQRLRDVFRPRV